MSRTHRTLHAILPVLLLALAAPFVPAQFVLSTDSGGMAGIDDGEITPDGRYAVVRENSNAGVTRVYDLASGQLAGRFDCPGSFLLSSAAQDAIAVTNDRAVSLGLCTAILDLNNPGSTIAVLDTGVAPRDLAISPDERRLAIRGGNGPPGGLFIVDLQTGVVLANTPGQPTDFVAPGDLDSVVISNDHAAFLSREATVDGATTRVTVFELFTPPSGMPSIVFETTTAGVDRDQLGEPHDIALTPDGQHVAVRSEFSVGLYKLDGSQSRRLWHKRLLGEPGPFGNSAMDSIEVTDEWVATVSRDSNGGFAAQVDLFDIAGNQRFDDVPGDPHDLTFTPDAERLLVRTSSGLFLYDLTNVPAGLRVPHVASRPLLTSHTSFGAGLDSLVATNDTAVTLSREGDSTDVDIWEVGATSLARRGGGVMDNQPLDLEVSPDETLLGVAGTRTAQVWDLVTGDRVLEAPLLVGADIYPWCDGIAMNDDSLVAFGYNDASYSGFFTGWVMIIDLFSTQTPYCATSPNSAGAGSTIYATGSPSEAANDLEVIARDLPPNHVVQFVYGAAQVNMPFGDGTLCVGGQAFRFPFGLSDAGGLARRPVDNAAAPRLGGAVMAGTTWSFQAIYRDPEGPGGMGGAGFNASDGVEITFGS